MLKGYKIKKEVNDFLGPEEILLDSQIYQESEDDFLAGQKIERPLAKKTILSFFVLLAIVFVVILGRVFWLQFVNGQQYSLMAQDNQLHTVPVSGPRGLIFDKNGNILAQNKAAYDVLINFYILGQDAVARKNKINKLRDLIGSLPYDSDLEKIEEFTENPPSQSVIFRSNLGQEKMLSLQSSLSELEGVFIEESSLRSYPLGAASSHVVGYLGQISDKERAKYSDYFLIEKVGKAGLESQYESFLRGTPGFRKYPSNSFSQTNDLPITQEGVAGHSLILHIDGKLQEKLFESLNKYYLKTKKQNQNVEGAAAVILNPQNGGVMALVSLPAYDANEIVDGLDREEFKNIFQNSQRPLFDRVISGQYPTGSIIKPIMAAAALQEEIVTPDTKIDDMNGALTFANPYSPGVVYHFRDWAVHGVVNLYSAIAKSCNIYFYIVGGGYQDREGLGIDRMVKYFRSFGLGSKNNIDIPGEQDGFVPTPQWKEKTKGERWYIGDTYHVSIGQGDFLATPLQMASAISAIANGGTVYQPQVVDKIIDINDNVVNDLSSRVISSNFVQQDYLAEVRKGMRQAVLEGSAVALNSLDVKSAGKTGTAQTNKPGQTHAWFAGFAPYDDPQIAIVVLVENGGEGHAAAVPVAKEVFDWYFSNK